MEPTTHNLEITNDALACRMFGNREKYDQLCDAHAVAAAEREAFWNEETEALGINTDITRLARMKIDSELSSFTGERNAQAIAGHVARALKEFSKDTQFAQAVTSGGSLEACCAEVLKNAGYSISDIEVYRRAAQFYFPNARVQFWMEITTGEEPMLGEIPEKGDPVGQTNKEKQPEVKKEEPLMDENVLSEEERKMADQFANQIDLTNSAMILQYGAGTQSKMADFSETALENAYKNFIIARAVLSEASLGEALMIPQQSVSVKVTKKNIMSVNVPVFDFQKEGGGDGNIFPYGMAFTSGELDSAMLSFSDAMEPLLRLAESEKTAQLLAQEIERTRRRVNALENVMIPNYQETIKYITMKLEENERANTTRLMKVKDMVAKKAIETKRKQEAAAFGE